MAAPPAAGAGAGAGALAAAAGFADADGDAFPAPPPDDVSVVPLPASAGLTAGLVWPGVPHFDAGFSEPVAAARGEQIEGKANGGDGGDVGRRVFTNRRRKIHRAGQAAKTTRRPLPALTLCRHEALELRHAPSRKFTQLRSWGVFVDRFVVTVIHAAGI